MDEKTKEKIRKKLLELKKEILFVIESREEALGSKDVSDEIDQATELVEQTMGSLMSSNFHKNLTRVDEALKQLEKGDYGLCEECGKEISPKRLDALPLAEYCIECKTELENSSEE